ncbi:MAG: ComF family protein [Patescibacteria group bacterium]
MNKLKYFFWDLLFPRSCLGCLELLGDLSDSHLCPVCRATIKFKSGFACAFCSAPVINGRTCPFCLAARAPTQRDVPLHYLDYLFVAATYEEPLVEKMLKTLKYQYVRSLAEEVAGVMIKYFEKKIAATPIFDFTSPLVVPVPLHRRRLNWRGFNQSELIAQKIAAHFSWPLNTEILKRAKYNRPQADIKDRASRIQNASGIFSCQKPEAISGKLALLIDDIATTGSTLDDCARALKGAGAVEVIGFVFARGDLKPKK